MVVLPLLWGGRRNALVEQGKRCRGRSHLTEASSGRAVQPTSVPLGLNSYKMELQGGMAETVQRAGSWGRGSNPCTWPWDRDSAGSATGNGWEKGGMFAQRSRFVVHGDCRDGRL